MSGRIQMRKYSATNFLNSLKRRIYVGDKGGYFALAAGTGKKVYGVKARYKRASGSTNVMKINKQVGNVPLKIRRKVRSNKGVRRA